MIYLNKDNQAAIDHVSNFLTHQWLEDNTGGHRYLNIEYGDINRGQQFKAFFVNEQDEKCCYCCRDIAANQHTELEHIIPRAVDTQADLIKYQSFSPILAANVMLQETFRTSQVELTTPPFPHHTAYHNIVASCNGHTFATTTDFTCCNRKRGDEFLPPFNLMQGCVDYLPDGTFVYDPPEGQEYVDILNLNKAILKEIRKLWKLFFKNNTPQQDIMLPFDEDTVTKLVTLAVTLQTARGPEDLKLIDNFKIESMWLIFQKYSFFYS